MKGMPGSMAQLMKQANQMQMKMKKAQEEIAKLEFDGTAGGGAVKARVNGESKIMSLTIDPEVMKAGDVEMLQDLVLAACNDAIKLAKETSQKEMEKITGGVGVPGNVLTEIIVLHIPALEQLVHELARLPGIGPKTAQRLAYYILRSRDEYVDRTIEALKRVKAEVHVCKQCYNYTDHDLCRYCTDPHRSDEVICLVEEPSDIVRIEGSGAFRGRYHVLHGAISPLDGIGPESLKIKELIHRLEQSQNGEKPLIKEVILALGSDLEGDTTVLYLSKILHQAPAGKNLKLSRIAQGVPIGSDIDFIDDRTMGRALENRVEL